MDAKVEKPRLVLIQGGGDQILKHEGPIARMGLRGRFEPLPKSRWVLIFLAKGLLLAAALAYFWK